MRAFAHALALLTLLIGQPALAQGVTLKLNDTLLLRDQEIPYGFDLRLSAVGKTRIGVDAFLDLRGAQAALPALINGTPLLEVCGNDTVLETIELVADGNSLRLDGRLQASFFVCENLGGGSFRRGEPRFDLTADVTAQASVEIVDNCALLDLSDLKLQPNRDLAGLDQESKDLQTARELLVEALALVLDQLPICPELPAPIASLDPTYGDVIPTELGDGGVGLQLRGSFDAGPRPILDVLDVLQTRGIIPGRP